MPAVPIPVSASVVRQGVGLLVLAIALPYLLNQARKPTRWVGRLFLWGMNNSHSDLTDWGLGHVPIEPGVSILDVGCGGGRTIRKLAAAAAGVRVSGVDYSIGSVETSRATNAKDVEAGRVEVRQASVSQLPYGDATFDLVTAVETHYYWPDLGKDIREVVRVMKPGGRFAVLAECYKAGKHDWAQGLAMLPLRGKVLSADEHREWFATAGLADVRVFEERGHGWICVTGRKPAA
jgi:SAM-dependent methyltransferase